MASHNFPCPACGQPMSPQGECVNPECENMPTDAGEEMPVCEVCGGRHNPDEECWEDDEEE